MSGLQTTYAQVKYLSTIDSTSISSGTLVIGGGIGLTKNLNVGGLSRFSSTIDASDTITGALSVSGGVSIAKSLYVGGSVNFNSSIVLNSTADSTSTNSGSFQTLGGAGIAKSLFVGNNTDIGGKLNVKSTTDSSSYTTGSVTLAGGIGIAGQLFSNGSATFNGDMKTNSTTTSTSSSTGALVVAGGAGISGTVTAGALNLQNTVTTISVDGTLADNSDSFLATQKAVKTYTDTTLNEFAARIKNPTGFPNNTESVITTNDETATFTIAPVGDSFYYYIDNVRYTKTTSDSIAIQTPLVTGLYYIYYQGTTLTITDVFTDTLFYDYAYVAAVYWNASTQQFVHVGDERHGMSMSPDTHRDLHYGLGTVYVSGLSPGDFDFTGDGATDAQAQFTIGEGVIIDEDLEITVQSKALTGSGRIFYLNGSAWTYSTMSGAFYSDSTKLYYNAVNNNVWSLQAVPDGQYVLGHVVATNDGLNHFILGQNIYSTIVDATQGAANELSSLYLVNLPTNDWLFIASIIYRSNSTFVNTIKGVIVKDSNGAEFIDWRQKKLNSAAGSTNSHSQLAGLGNDDHLQYAMVNGRTTDITKVNNTINATATSSGALQVMGGASVTKDLFVGGNINVPTVQVTATTESSSSTTGALTVSGGIGIFGNAFVGGDLQVDGSLLFESSKITSTIDASSTSTGALQVVGGVGIGEHLFVGNDTDVHGLLSTITASVSSTATSTSVTTGALIVGGGAGFGGNVNIGGGVTIYGTTNATSTDTGSLIVEGGMSVADDLFIGGTAYGAFDGTFNGSATLTGSFTGTSTTQTFQEASTNIATTAFVQNALNTINSATSAPTGFENKTDSVVTYNPTTRRLTITPTGSAFNVWIDGYRYQYTVAQSITHAASVGVYYFYFNTSGLQSGTSFPSMRTIAPTAFVYFYDATHYIVCEERHQTVMDPDTHAELHLQIGTFWKSGLALTDYNVNPAIPVDADNTFASGSGVISDEQLDSQISAVAVGGPYNVFYIAGTGQWFYTIGNTLPFAYQTGGYIEYNQNNAGNWALTQLTDDQYVNYYVVYIPSLDSSMQVLIVPGQTAYSSLSLAQSESFYNLVSIDVPFPEFLPYYQVTFHASSAFTNTGKCSIANVTKLAGNRVSVMNSQANNHEALSGLQLAGPGVTWGHVNDTIQSIYGAKTFADTTQSTSATTGALIVAGGMGVDGNAYVGGSENIVGTVTIQDTTVSTNTTSGALVVSGGVGVGNSLNVANNVTTTTLNAVGTTQSTDTATGAVIVDGGVGIAKNLNVGGNSVFSGTVQALSETIVATTQSTDTASGALQVAGGAAIVKNLNVGGNTTITGSLEALTGLFDSTVNATSTTGGSVTVAGGVGIAKDVFIGGLMNITGQIVGTTEALQSTIDSTDTATGALTVAGGVGIAKSVNIGANATVIGLTTTTTATVISTINTTDPAAGALTVTGGVGVGKNLYVGGDTNILSTTTSTSATSGAFVVAGGAGFGSAVNIAGATTVSNLLTTTTEKIISTVDATSTSTGALQVAGGVGIAANMYVGGQANITQLLTGTTATFTTTNDTTSTSTGALTVAGGVGIGASVSVGGSATITNNMGAATGTFTSLTDSTSTSTGAVTVVGGVGIGENLNVGGDTNISSTTLSTSASTGAFVVSGGVGFGSSVNIKTDANIGNNLSTLTGNVTSTIASTSTSSGAFVVSGGTGIGGDLFVGGSVNFSSALNVPTATITDTVNATSTSTGALQVIGGVGIGKDVFIGGSTTITQDLSALNGKLLSVAESTSTSTGALQVAGGAGIGLNLNVGGSANITSALTSLTAQTLSTVNSTDSASGSLVVAGGAGIAKDVFIGGSTTISGDITATNGHFVSTVDSTSTDTGAVIISGGVGIAKKLNVGDNATFNNFVSLTLTQDSTSITTGSLQLAGGAAISKNLNIGGLTRVLSTVGTTSSTVGALVVSGGVGIADNVAIGGEKISIQNNWGQQTNQVVKLNSVIGIAPATTETIYSLTMADGPIMLDIKALGYDATTKTFFCLCAASFIFIMESGAVQVVMGPTENLVSNDIGGVSWNFQQGSFGYVDHGSGAVDITFTNTGSINDTLNISTVTVNMTTGVVV